MDTHSTQRQRQVGPTHIFTSPFPALAPNSCGFLGNRASISSKLEHWQSELKCDKDRTFLLNGIENGFRITQEGSKTAVNMRNHKSAYQYREEVETELIDQIQKGHYVIASEKPTIVSALAAIPKEDGSVRLIHDGSRPAGLAMNDYSLPESVKFQTLSDACELAKPGYYCAKVDLQAAYRSVCIHPDDYSATGIKWAFQENSEPTYLFDTRLPFGSNVGPSIFHRLSQSVRRCMLRKGMAGIIAYIDDFLITAATKYECNRKLLQLIRLLRELGFNISWKKVVGPTQKITFLGVDIDTRDSTLSLGEDKLGQLHQRLLSFQNKRRASKQQLQSLAGSLNWACQAVRGGKFFLRRILDTIKPLQQQRHKALLTTEFKADLGWWLSFLRVFNGTAFFDRCSREHVFVDACNLAAGAFHKGDWAYSVFQQDIPAASDLHINYKEVCAVVMAVQRWADQWRGKTVIVHTDSTVTKAIINKGRSKNVYVNCLLRKMAWECAKRDCKLIARHVPGSLNIFADTISRLHENNLSKLIQQLCFYHRGTVPAIIMTEHMSQATLQFLLYRSLTNYLERRATARSDGL